MTRRVAMVIAGVALAGLTIAAMPARSQEDRRSETRCWQRQLADQMARMQAELARSQAQMSAQIAQLHQLQLPRLAQLEAQRGVLRASLAQQQAQLRAALAAQQAAAGALRADDVVDLINDDTGWVGITIAEVTPEKAKELKLPAVGGVIVTEVEENSPAAKAGLKASDVITEFNGQRVQGIVQFRRLVRETPPGRTVPVTVWRDGRTQNLSMEVGSRGKQFERSLRIIEPREFRFELPQLRGQLFFSRTPTLGIEAQDVHGQLGQYFGAPDGEGVLVTDVQPSTPAEKAGLKAGDVITKVDGERVRTISDLREKLREAREKKSVTLSVLRKGAEISLSVEIVQPQPPQRRRAVSYRVTI